MGCLLLSSERLFALGGLHEAIQEAFIKVPIVCLLYAYCVPGTVSGPGSSLLHPV